MTDISDRYRRRAERFTDRVAAVPSERWESPSPCPEWTARDVVRHVVDTSHMFLGFIGERAEPRATVDEDPMAAWLEARAAIERRLDDPETAAKQFDGVFGPTVWEESVDRFLSGDLVVHGWDLARATGGDERIDTEDLDALDSAWQSIDESLLRSPGAFGPAVEPPPDANRQERFLAFLGRDPRR